jgi:hypothetical protein
MSVYRDECTCVHCECLQYTVRCNRKKRLADQATTRRSKWHEQQRACTRAPWWTHGARQAGKGRAPARARHAPRGSRHTPVPLRGRQGPGPAVPRPVVRPPRRRCGAPPPPPPPALRPRPRVLYGWGVDPSVPPAGSLALAPGPLN